MVETHYRKLVNEITFNLTPLSSPANGSFLSGVSLREFNFAGVLIVQVIMMMLTLVMLVMVKLTRIMLFLIVLTMMIRRTIVCWQVDTGADQQQEAATLERRPYITRPAPMRVEKIYTCSDLRYLLRAKINEDEAS